MKISEDRQDGGLIVSPAGRLDSANAPALERWLSAAVERGDTLLIVDLKALDYISSIGLSVLLSVAKKIKRAKGKFVISGVNDRIGAIMEISGFNKVLTIVPTVEQALAATR
jgi:anti-anti-sigma factor